MGNIREQIEALFIAEYPKDMADSLIGIFRCLVAKGKSPMEAYKETLLRHIKIAGIEV